MGCDFSISLVHGVRIPAGEFGSSKLTWNDSTCNYDEFEPLRVYDTGGYTDSLKNDIVVGVLLGRFDEYMEPKAFRLEEHKFSKAERAKVLQLAQRYELGTFLIPEWS